MHLLVLSAFRRRGAPHLFGRGSLNAPSGAQCFPTPLSEGEVLMYELVVSMHLLVLSAFRREICGDMPCSPEDLSQCTFWCSVLSDDAKCRCGYGSGLVSMHLLVLSAFRLEMFDSPELEALGVSMHLLVLSAFRRGIEIAAQLAVTSLNAPSGAQCFPTTNGGHGLRPVVSQCTFWCSVLSDYRMSPSVKITISGLNAPSGAQCFPTRDNEAVIPLSKLVSMHLLVLSAFRPHRGRI